MGAALPLLVGLLAPAPVLAVSVITASLVCLSVLGALAAGAGGASPWVGASRVTIWGALAMALTYAVGALFGTSVT